MRYALVLGEALVDLLDTECGGQRVYRPAVGGAPLNVAVGLARLAGGGPAAGQPVAVEFAGSLGDDALAERILEVLVGAGVGIRGVRRVDVPTALAVTTFEGAEPDFRFYGQPPSYGLFGPDDLDPALVSGAAALYCGSISLLCAPVLAAARRAWATAGPLRAFDPNVRAHLLADPAGQRAVVEEFAAGADLVKLSAADAALLYPGEPVPDVARRLRGPGGAVVVVTLGARGALLLAGDRPVPVAAPAVRAVDTTGAGDAVMAALLYRLFADGVPAGVPGWRDQVAFALRVAALVCESPGGATAMPTPAQLRDRFPAQSGPTGASWA